MNTLNHVAFIMDGNGRWGKLRGKGRNHGHIKGVETVKKVVKFSLKLKIPIITFYVFSSENWKRPKKEVNFLLNLIKQFFSREIDKIKKQGIKLNIIGEVDKLKPDVKLVLKKSSRITKDNKKIIVNLAINYGSKNEILNTLKKIKKKINLKNFEKNLYTKKLAFPDILIRTGGHNRLSNFMLWQLAYSEIFFLKKLWPEFTGSDLQKIIEKFKKIKRNYGGI